MAISAFYQKSMARALPGQISDTSAYNVDGACVLTTTDGLPILVGVAVQHDGVDAWGNKKMKPFSGAGSKAYGVAIRSHFQTVDNNGRASYENGGGINVMTEGRVWMLSREDSAPAYGAPVKLEQDSGVVDLDSGQIETNWITTGDFTKFGDLPLVEVQVLPA